MSYKIYVDRCELLAGNRYKQAKLTREGITPDLVVDELKKRYRELTKYETTRELNRNHIQNIKSQLEDIHTKFSADDDSLCPKINNIIHTKIKSDTYLNQHIKSVQVRDMFSATGLVGDYLLIENDRPVCLVEMKRTYQTLEHSFNQSFVDIVNQYTLCEFTDLRCEAKRNDNIKFVFCVVREEKTSGNVDEDKWTRYWASHNQDIHQYRKLKKVLKQNFGRMTFKELSMSSSVYAPHDYRELEIELSYISDYILDVFNRRIKAEQVFT